ncbi:MAG: hypothetical protein AMS21_03830 [Gemmatimonas sp. SG8_38_2]|nr:MAG: hypothetical protein AMS21_03830 [Gemmatimonas sp. SG8_38_2]
MILLTVAVIFFAGQNLGPVEVVFLFWHFYVPLSLIALVPLLIGLLVGFVGTAVVVKRKDKKVAPGPEPTAAQLEAPAAAAGAEIKDEEEIAG